MTLIDGDKLADSIRDKLCDHLYCWDCSMCLEDGGCKVEKWLDDAPSIDIVRCQDCKHWVHNFNGCARNPCTEPWYATDFCNYGEREGE